jgi:hypothetical protein
MKTESSEKTELSRTLLPCWTVVEGKPFPVYVFVQYVQGRLRLSGAVGSTDPIFAKQYGQINASFPPPFPKSATPGPHSLNVLHYSLGWFERDWRDLLYYWELYHMHRADEVPSYVHEWLRRLPD